jgi:hypothetical protein
MSKFDVRWRSRELAPPWKRILSFFCDIVVLSPPVLLVAGARSFNPFPGVSLTYWILCSLWGWYTFIFGIGLPLYKGISSIGDILLKLAVTDVEGRRIGKLKLLGRQLVCCFLLLWMLLPSFLYAGIIVNLIFYASVFHKDRRKGAYMHAVDRLFQTTVMTVEFESPEKSNK